MTDSIFGVDTKDWWCQQVYQVEKPDGLYIGALIRRRYGDGFDDIEVRGNSIDFDDSGQEISMGPKHERYIGIERALIYPKTTDNDPDSPTYTKRIDNKDAGHTGISLKFTVKASKEAIDEISAMCGNPTTEGFEGGTTYYWWFKGVNARKASSLNELTNNRNSEVQRLFDGLGAAAKKAVKA